MLAAARLAVLTGTLAAAGGLAVVDADAEPKRLKLEVGAAGPGAALDITGRRLAGRRTKVTVGGGRARVVSGNARRVRIVVPKVSPGVKRVVARSGRRRATGRLRVLAPFRGKIGARPDRARAATATVGPDGGSVSATGRDGTRYDLAIPAGAVAAATAITVTPVAKFSGVPLTGGRPAGVVFAPEHLTLSTPATLRITYRSRVPKNAFGFTFDSSTGGSFAIARPKVAGAVVEVPVEHFSGAGSGLGNPQNFAAIVQAELNRLGNRRLTFGEAEELAGLIVQWASVFGPAFCGTQPVCGNAATIVLTNVKRLLADACPEGAQPPIATLTQIEQINRIESLRQQVDGLLTGPETGAGTDVPACHRRILRVMIDRAINGLSLYPAGSSKLVGGALAQPADAAELAQFPGPRASADIDDDGVVTAIEWLVFLAAQAATAGDTTASQDVQTVATSALASVLQEGIDTCNDDLDEGKEILDPGQRLAERLVILATEFFNANQDCKPKVIVSPNPVGLDTGDAQQFRARANFTDPLGPLVFDWSATGGTIAATSDPAVVDWTAPNTPGDYSITAATSLLVRFQVSGSASITVGCSTKAADTCSGIDVLGRLSASRAFARVDVTNPSGQTFGDQHTDENLYTTADLAPLNDTGSTSAQATLAPSFDISGNASATIDSSQTLTPTGGGGLALHIAGSSSAAVSATENVSGTANADSTGFGTNYLRLIIHIGTPMTADCTVAWDGTAPSAVAHANAIVEAKIGTDPNHDGVPDSGKLSAQLFKAVGFPDGTPHASAALDPGDYVVELRQNTDARWITNFHGSPGSATQSSAGHADCTLS